MARRLGKGVVSIGLGAVVAMALAVPARADPPPAPAAAPEDYPPPEEAAPAPDVAPIAKVLIATGSMQPVDRLIQPVTVLTADDINRIGGADITRVLALVPGITWQRYGAAGAWTGIHLRGAATGDTLVLIDGVRMQDVASPAGGFDFGTLTGVGIDRIEVLRGSGSVAWGSGALGGVVSIDTPETKGLNASIEAGSRDTLAGNLVYGLVHDSYALALNSGYTATDDVPNAHEDSPGGFHQWRLGGRGRINLSPSLSLVAVARYADTKAVGDTFPLPRELAGTTPLALETEQLSARAGAHYAAGALTLDGGYSLATTRTVYQVADAGVVTGANWLGTSKRAEFSGTWHGDHDIAVDFGADDEWTAIEGTSDGRNRARLASAHVIVGWYGARGTLNAGVRQDDHSDFGGHTSAMVGAALQLDPHLRLRAGYSEGFRAPSLYQLHAVGGNPALRPETGQTYDLALAYANTGETLRAALSLYRRDSRDLIQFALCGAPADPVCTAATPNGGFANVAAARAQGAEFELTWVPSISWRLTALYSHDEAIDRTAGSVHYGLDLAMRPRDAATLSTDWTTPFKGMVVGADLHLQSASWGDAANTVRLGPGTVATLRASLPFGNFLDFYGRIENLFNDHAPTAAGYGSPGRGVFAGVRVRY